MNEPAKQPHLTVTGSIDDVLVWIDRMAERGIYKSSSARFKRNAIEQFVSVLGPEEPRTAKYLVDEIENISNRWATKEAANPETARTYKSRAATAIKDYLSYQENPQGFRARSGAATPKKSKKTEKKPTVDAATTSPEPAPPQPPSSPRPDATPLMRNFPLGKDREPFIYAIPDGMKVSDVIKIACHLLTLAEDFDPMNPRTAAVFALARREE